MDKPKCDYGRDEADDELAEFLYCDEDAVIRVGGQNLCAEHAPQNVVELKRESEYAAEILEKLGGFGLTCSHLRDAIAALEPKP